MRILITDELSLSTILSPAHRSFLYTFSFMPTVITARQLAAVTPPHHQVTILEGSRTPDPTIHFDVVHINFKTALAPRAYQIADRYRSHETTVILSGYHPTALPQEAAQHADSVLIGDATTLWPRVITDLEHHTLKPTYTTTPSDRLLLPSTRDVHLYGIQLSASIEATRGCPHRCDFCQDSNIREGDLFRARPLDDVIAEVTALPQKIFFFTDFSLTIDLAYTKDLFCRLRHTHKKFICGGNIDVLGTDPELLALASQAGCIEWISGLETFTQAALDHAHKPTNIVDEYAAAVRAVHRHHMAIFGTFILGFDEDTSDVFAAMHAHINRVGLDSVNFALLTPYPGTPLFDRLDREGRLLTKDWALYDRHHVVFRPKHMTPDELYAGFRRLTRVYSRLPSMGYRSLRSLRAGPYPFIATAAGNLSQYLKAT